jgi:transposase
MFLKRCHRTKNGKEHVYWQLVESYRTVRGSRHRVVAYLGELRGGERKGWARLGAMLDEQSVKKVKQLSLFEGEREVEEEGGLGETVEVNLGGVTVAGTRDFGEVWLALCLWRILGLEELMERVFAKGEEDVSWGVMACVVTIARFVEPASELHIEETWYGRTALKELLGVGPGQVNEHRLYRTLDRVLPAKGAIEAHLKGRIGELFKPDYELLLYDVTSTYFEGEAENNPQAQRGYSRDGRAEAKQICLGLVVTREGFPVGYEVFAGNLKDISTLEAVVKAIEKKYGRVNRIWVLDRGMVSEEKLAWLRQRGARYVVGTAKEKMKPFEKELVGGTWAEVREGIEVKKARTGQSQDTYVLCRSSERAKKERGIRERFVGRIKEGLKTLQAELKSAKTRRDLGKIQRRMGRLLQRNWRASGAFQIEVKEDRRRRSGIRFTWRRRKAHQKWAAHSEGCYLLRTNVTDQSPEELWRTYMQLTEVEAAFRTAKSDLKIRPVWHQVERRVQAHILFSFLAYALWKTLQTWMERAGLGGGARTLLEEMARIKANDVILPTSTGRDVTLCCITRPDPAQRALIERLGLVTPERLGRPTWVPAPKILTANVV